MQNALTFALPSAPGLSGNGPQPETPVPDLPLRKSDAHSSPVAPFSTHIPEVSRAQALRSQGRTEQSGVIATDATAAGLAAPIRTGPEDRADPDEAAGQVIFSAQPHTEPGFITVGATSPANTSPPDARAVLVTASLVPPVDLQASSGHGAVEQTAVSSSLLLAQPQTSLQDLPPDFANQSRGPSSITLPGLGGPPTSSGGASLSPVFRAGPDLPRSEAAPLPPGGSPPQVGADADGSAFRNLSAPAHPEQNKPGMMQEKSESGDYREWGPISRNGSRTPAGQHGPSRNTINVAQPPSSALMPTSGEEDPAVDRPAFTPPDSGQTRFEASLGTTDRFSSSEAGAIAPGQATQRSGAVPLEEGRTLASQLKDAGNDAPVARAEHTSPRASSNQLVEAEKLLRRDGPLASIREAALAPARTETTPSPDMRVRNSSPEGPATASLPTSAPDPLRPRAPLGTVVDATLPAVPPTGSDTASARTIHITSATAATALPAAGWTDLPVAPDLSDTLSDRPHQPIAARSAGVSAPPPNVFRASDHAAPLADMVSAAPLVAHPSATPASPPEAIPMSLSESQAKPELASTQQAFAPSNMAFAAAAAMPAIAPAGQSLAPSKATVLTQTQPLEVGMTGQLQDHPKLPDEAPSLFAAQMTGSDRPVQAPGATPASQPHHAETQTARHVAAQIAEIARPHPSGPVELTLDPEELGRLQLTFTREQGVLHVLVTADRNETMDLMRRHIDQLAQGLRQEGFRETQFSFGDGNGGGGAGTSSSSPEHASSRDGEMSEAAPAAESKARTAKPLPVGNAAMDLRI